MNIKIGSEERSGEKMLTSQDIIRGIRKLHTIREKDPVPEELRGWSFHTPPIKPRAYLGLGVSEISNRYCETKRDVYLRRVMRIKPSKTQILQIGSSIHKIFTLASDRTREIIFSKNPLERLERELLVANKRVSEICIDSIYKYCISLYKKLLITWVSEGIKSEAMYGGLSISSIPWFTELRVDGTLIGLSDKLSIDALMNPLIIAEIKSGLEKDFHKLSLAGYALAIESSLEIPVDYGVIIYVNSMPENPEIRYETYYISPDLRKEFIDARDDLIDLILSRRDPGKPRLCPDTCPFKEFCG